MNRNSIITAAALTLIAAGLLLAGPLDPPAGPVTSTYKTLTEVEPRIAINATNTPGDADSLFKITQPGSYYLTGNVTGVAAKHGVEIAVAVNGPSVTIDLMGYELAGDAGSLDGISVTVFSTRNVAIRNGTVRAWGGDGVDVSGSTNNLLDGLRVEGNRGRGIDAGSASTITGCTASFNTGNGIFASTGSTVTGCTAFANTGTGIFADSGSTVTGCTARLNSGDGVSAGSSSTVTGCTAQFNIGRGIFTFNGSTVTGCTARLNSGDGIQVVSDCRVTDNSCDSNGNGSGDGAGIHATSSDNRIEGNNCTGADRGIDVDVAGNIIIRNTCSGNTTNWDVVAGNICLVVQGVTGAAILGNSGGVAPGSTDPNANFSY